MKKTSIQSIHLLCLGQLLSLCITGSSTASSALWKHHSVNIPYTQNTCVYILLAVLYGSTYLISHPNAYSYIHWRFIGFSFIDVQANVLAVLAFKNTSVLSALILASWSVPCVLLLSILFLGARYNRVQLMCSFMCLMGLGMLIYGDIVSQENTTDNHSWIGDMICLVSATLYAISNVTEEHLIKQYTSSEFLGKIGLVGAIICGIQAYYFEYDEWMSIQWSWSILALIMVYVTSIFIIYSLVPIIYRQAGATFLSMSMITSNFYSLFVGIFILDAKMPPLYPLAYALVIINIILFTMTSTPSTISPDDVDDECSKPLLSSC
ncbi:solute carrier family 35 member SLC35F1/F2/F6 [Pilobolus umbonatus]|nr:solute carrier family 35 member SLC35F1/F2/F6 [Pilobolus umbonatus]